VREWESGRAGFFSRVFEYSGGVGFIVVKEEYRRSYWWILGF